MRIAVCDDDIYMLRLLGDYLYRLRGSRLEFSVEFFKSSADFERALERRSYDLILLDMEMDKADGGGIARAARARKREEKVFILYTAYGTEYALEALRRMNCYFLLKPFMFADLRRILENVYYCSAIEYRKFGASFNHDVVSLELREIVYFESYQRKTYVCTAAGCYRVTERLDDIEKRLPPELFLRIHQGYLVNLSHVKKIKGQELYLKDGRRLEVSYRRRRAVYEKIRNYLTKTS